MFLDNKTAKILSEFCLDLGKARAIGTSISPLLSKETIELQTLFFGLISRNNYKVALLRLRKARFTAFHPPS